MVKVIKKINGFLITLIFAGTCCLAFFIVLFFCFPAISGEFTIFGNKVVFVQTDRLSDYVPDKTFVSYSQNLSNIKVGDIVLFDYQAKSYIQVVDSIQLVGGVQTFSTSDNIENLTITKQNIYGKYLHSHLIFSQICVGVKDWYPLVMYIGIPSMFVIGVFLAILQLNENKKAKEREEKQKLDEARQELKKNLEKTKKILQKRPVQSPTMQYSLNRHAGKTSVFRVVEDDNYINDRVIQKTKQKMAERATAKKTRKS